MTRKKGTRTAKTSLMSLMAWSLRCLYRRKTGTSNLKSLKLEVFHRRPDIILIYSCTMSDVWGSAGAESIGKRMTQSAPDKRTPENWDAVL